MVGVEIIGGHWSKVLLRGYWSKKFFLGEVEQLAVSAIKGILRKAEFSP